MASIIGGIVEGVLHIADKYIPDAAEKDKFKIEMAQLEMQSQQSQIDVNKVEAANTNVFVSGWRPFIGWCCGAAFAYHLIIQPFLAFIMAASGHVFPLPEFDTATLNTTLMGLLGLGAMRTFEKVKGVS